MKRTLLFALSVTVAIAALAGEAAARQAQTQEPFEPEVGQPGKDVVWVPTTPELVEKMLDMAKVTPQDFVVDLGSGDGRNVIAAARRGATAVGFEYNPDMVALSRRLAREAGVAERATFVQGDMYEADFSKASVLALFLLPENLNRLQDKFLKLKPGTRIVLNTFGVNGWEPDETERIEDCSTWCTSMLYIVPAPVAGTWTTPQGELVLSQEFQKVTGSFTTPDGKLEITDGRLRGESITFTAGGQTYSGQVSGDRMELKPATGAAMTATRAGS